MKDNKPINPLLIAFGAITTYTIAIPLLDAVVSIAHNHINLHNIKLQAEVQKIQDTLQEQPPVHAIGFQIPTEENCDE